jgi:hypothetical protein
MSGRVQKRSTADSSNPLQQIGILQHVLDHVGPGHWCFVAEVCNLWRDLCIKVASRYLETKSAYGLTKMITCTPQMTMFSAMFASPSRVRHAHKRGIRYETVSVQHAAGTYADIDSLKAAHELGMSYAYGAMLGAASCDDLAVLQFMRAQGCRLNSIFFKAAAARGYTAMCAYLHAEGCPWTTEICDAAAGNGHASTLRWLHEHGFDWYDDTIHQAAAKGGSVEALAYVQQQGIVFTAEKLTDMLSITGALSHLAAAKWLRQQGAEWPEVLQWGDQQWSGDVLAWARAEGCASLLNWSDIFDERWRDEWAI